MAKKNKQKLQRLINKKEQLQQLEQSHSIVSFAPSIEAVDKSITAPKQPAKQTETLITSRTGHSVTRDLRWTLVSLIFIALCLTAATIAARQTTLDDQFGNWLYQTLKLNS